MFIEYPKIFTDKLLGEFSNVEEPICNAEKPTKLLNNSKQKIKSYKNPFATVSKNIKRLAINLIKDIKVSEGKKTIKLY